MSLIDQMRKAASECPFGSTVMDIQYKLDIVLDDIPPLDDDEEEKLEEMCEMVISEFVPFPAFLKQIPPLFYKNGKPKFQVEEHNGVSWYMFMESNGRGVVNCNSNLQLARTSELRKIANIIFPLIKVKKMNGQDLITLIGSISNPVASS